ncbi:MAG: hypothetical protein LBC29_02320 [Propionibacteriaceae bacterium]|nr:hypothetical protein [Propionibacteriaceae bacterium]
MTCLLTSCNTGGVGSYPLPPPTTVNLNWEQASIDFPLERFEMSPSEMATMWAARNIAYVRCVTGKDEVPAIEMERSANMLKTLFTRFDVPDWVFGWWDTDFIRTQGEEPVDDGDFMPGTETPASDEQAMACVATQELKDLTPGGMTFMVEADTAFSDLDAARVDSIKKTYFSTLAESLAKQMGNCLAESGYQIAPRDRDGTPAVFADDSLGVSPEEKLRIALVSAECNDRLGVTQQLANMMAGYQEQYIAEHEAELLAIRAEADRRLARAHELLHEVGLE